MKRLLERYFTKVIQSAVAGELQQHRSTLKDADWWFSEIWPHRKSQSGESVTESTAMGISAFFAAIRAISEDTAKLPLKVFQKKEDGSRQAVPKHPVHRLLHDQASEEMTAFTLRETLTAHALGYHGGFAEIVRRGDGRPAALYVLDPRRVTVKRGNDDAVVYVVTMAQGQQVTLRADQVLHLHGLGLDGITGYAIAQVARDSLGAALATQGHRGRFFGNSAMPGGVIETPASLSQKAFDNLEKSMEQRYSKENAYKTMILEEGTKFHQNQIDPDKAQMIEAHQFSVEDVARWFRIPPHKIGHLERSTNNNIEHQAIEYVQDTLMSWLVRWEQEIRRKLFLPGEVEHGIYAEHLVDALQRADQASRSAFYTAMFYIGALSPNEIREMENRNPIEGGDVYFVQTNLQTLEQAQKEPEPVPPALQGLPGPDDDDEPDEDDTDDERARAILRSHIDLLTIQCRRLLRMEADKIRRARSNHRLTAWAKEFYGDDRRYEHLRTVLGPTLDALAESLWIVRGGTAQVPADLLADVFGITGEILQRHIERSLAEMHDDQLVEQWPAHRAVDDAESYARDIADLIESRIEQHDKTQDKANASTATAHDSA